MDERVDPRGSANPEPPVSREATAPARTPWRGGASFVVALIVAAGLAFHFWPHGQPAPDGGPAPAGRGMQGPPQLVGFATVDKGDIRVILNELGTVTSLGTVTVKTQIAGQFVEIGFKEGQTVSKGDFLAQVDPRPYQVALQQAQGQLARDQGLLDQAQVDLARYVTLGKQDSISKQQVDDQRFIVEQYKGTVQADQAAVNNAKLNLTYCHIVSPIDGQVGLRQVDPGNYVQTSDANGLVVITQIAPISVLFSVPEDSLADILPELRSGAAMTVDAYDRANVRKLASGQVSTLDNQIDTTTGTVKVRAVFDNADHLLFPNQFVNARLLVRTLKDTTRVPVAAIQRGEPGTFVYVIGADDTVSVRVIKVGPTDDGYAAILSGLEPGDKVVTDGTDRLRDGIKVTLRAPGGGGGRSGHGGGRGATAGPDGGTGQSGDGRRAGGQNKAR
jgi:multidrug efflux system membrane fusion protein